jgi:hypothetical protein
LTFSSSFWHVLDLVRASRSVNRVDLTRFACEPHMSSFLCH